MGQVKGTERSGRVVLLFVSPVLLVTLTLPVLLVTLTLPVLLVTLTLPVLLVTLTLPVLLVTLTLPEVQVYETETAEGVLLKDERRHSAPPERLNGGHHSRALRDSERPRPSQEGGDCRGAIGYYPPDWGRHVMIIEREAGTVRYWEVALKAPS
ncbi:unnamed protein product [Boreogadus saida]